MYPIHKWTMWEFSTHSHAKVHMTMLGKQEINLQWSKILVEFYINDMKIVIVALYSVLLGCATLCYPSTEQLKCCNYMVSPSNAYLEENEKIHFHHHCQTHLIIIL